MAKVEVNERHISDGMGVVRVVHRAGEGKRGWRKAVSLSEVIEGSGEQKEGDSRERKRQLQRFRDVWIGVFGKGKVSVGRDAGKHCPRREQTVARR